MLRSGQGHFSRHNVLDIGKQAAPRFAGDPVLHRAGEGGDAHYRADGVPGFRLCPGGYPVGGGEVFAEAIENG